MDTPAEVGPATKAFSSRPESLPFPLKVLICFLAFDAFERTGGLLMWALQRAQGPELTTSEFDPNGPIGLTSLGLWIMVDLLLIVLLLLRTWWGRVWTFMIFGIHLSYLAWVLVVSKPQLWLYLDGTGRARLATTLAIDLLALVYLATSDSARRILRR